MRPIVVVGAGVNGLCCGIRLREAGLPVRIVAKERTPHTTSDTAAAIFFPFGVKPWDRVSAWAKTTRGELERLSRDPTSGVSSLELIEVYDRRHEKPWWGEVVTEYRRASPAELPADYKDGFVTRVPLVEMPIYMPFLERRFLDSGGTIEAREVQRLQNLSPEADVVVNCTGVDAHHVVPDPGVFPLRGQTVRLPNHGARRGIIDELTPRALAHTIPRSHDIVAGGTLTKGDWSLHPDPAVEREILAKAKLLDPAIDTTKVLGRSVGLRPGRPEVRLDAERRGRFGLVHNYGHAGAGVSLSWGCADEVVGLVRGLVASGASTGAKQARVGNA